MKAALLYGKDDIRIENIDIPEIDNNEILLKVKSAAICGTDIRMYKNGYEGVNKNNPLILGHEISGTIHKVGENVKNYKVGMRVAVAPNMGCGYCDMCVSGNTQLCNEYKALGINIPGGFAEYVKIPETAIRQGNIIELDDSVSYDDAAINEPFSCAFNGFSQYEVNPGDNVLIIGAGPIGLLHAKLAKMAGASNVIINDISVERLVQCKKIDSSFITLTSQKLEEDIKKITNNKGLNVCVTACPSPEAQSQSLKLMAIGGRVNFFGGLPKHKENVSINTNIIHYRQLVITGSTRSSISHYRKTLSLISNKVVSVKELITGKFDLDHIKDAIDCAGNAQGLKNIIVF